MRWKQSSLILWQQGQDFPFLSFLLFYINPFPSHVALWKKIKEPDPGPIEVIG